MNRRLARHALLLAVFLLPALAAAQTGFSFVPVNTDTTVSQPGYIAFESVLTNTSDTDDIFMLDLLDESVPDDWTTSMCTHTNCFGYFIRTVYDTLAAGAGDDMTSIDFSANSNGNGTVRFRITSLNNPSDTLSITFTVAVGGDAVDEQAGAMPSTFSLAPVYPNPFNSTARVAFNLPRAQRVNLAVFDALGRRVMTLQNGMLAAGHHEAVFDAGRGLASGVYIVRLESDGLVRTTKALLVR